MAYHATLSERIGHIFSKLTKKGKLTALEVKEAMREVRIALLEADVSLSVVKNFVNTITEKAQGEAILKSLEPSQQVIKIVNEELIALMGSTHQKLEVSSKPPTVVMMCGLQGAGKTTMCGKLGHYLKKQGKKPLLVACDVQRPAAITQLKITAEKAGVGFYEKGTINPVKIALAGIEQAKSFAYDTVILDTAGRLHINAELMNELKNIKSECHPTEILLTVDAMTGQDAVTVAKSFDDMLSVTGVILTKLDGDTRGGATLSVKSVTGKPIKFIGTGEKIGDLEPFHPERMASRILGMGDVLTLIEKAQTVVTEEEAKKLEKKFAENSFTLEDFLHQFQNLSKMGNIKDMMAMMPNMGPKFKIKDEDLDEDRIKRMKAIIQSMTSRERLEPKILNSSRRRRVAAGSGTTIQEVNQLLKQFDQLKDVMKQMGGGKSRKDKRFPMFR
jgi:signal recognition particle subunit SRP54